MNVSEAFRKLVFTQVMLGIVASTMAERNPGLLLVTGAIGAMSWYVTEGPTGKALPRWLINLGALLAVFWLAMELVGRRVYVVAAMGHFTLLLQLLMLYSRKTNREYAQLLVLSLLQMIGASVLSVSMIYGAFLVVYCVVALSTVLLFHLSSTAEHVHEKNLHARPANTAVGRPRHVGNRGAKLQLRLIGVLIGAVCMLVAVAVFVVMPRTGKTQLDFGPVPEAAPRQTGFSNSVTLGGGRIGTGSREPMLNMQVFAAGQSIGQDDYAWLIRGAALDDYDSATHTWRRSPYAMSSDRVYATGQIAQDASVKSNAEFSAHITLRDARQRVLFSVVSTPFGRGSPGPRITQFESEALSEIAMSPIDSEMRATESVIGAVEYTMTWPLMPTRLNFSGEAATGFPPGIDELDPDMLPQAAIGYGLYDQVPEEAGGSIRIGPEEYARGWDVLPQRVERMAMRVLRDAGLSRDPHARHTEQDMEIAAALAQHLRTHFTYSLSNPTPPGGSDPVIAFLFQTHRGHCELFAAGLTALCRSVGIPARVITGFRASEYNTVGDYYVIRQSNAHAWTEIDGGPGIGWVTFDATPTAEVRAEHEVASGLLTSIRAFYEHVEFAWIKSVVAFDSRTQENVMRNINSSIAESTGGRKISFKAVAAWFDEVRQNLFLDQLQWGAVILASSGLLVGVATMVRLYTVRRRRLAALQLGGMPASTRRALSRRLRFYLVMLDMLERHGYSRPAWQSPYSFAQELAEANPMRFDPVVALTELFYEVRFGHREIDDDRRGRIRAHLKQLEHAISGRGH